MNNQQVIRELEVILEEWACAHAYGTIEVQVSDGVPALLRKSITTKLQSTGENNRAKKEYR